MQFESLVKRLLVAFCLMTLAACSSTPENTTDTTDTSTVEETTVDTSTVEETTVTVEEQMRMESERKRQERTIYFEFDDSTVKQQYLEVLELHAKFLMQSGGNVTLEGHADERGTQAYNLALGERRGNAVKQYLMNFGLSASQINVVSYGEERPADGGHSEMSWAKNRRVEIVYR